VGLEPGGFYGYDLLDNLGRPSARRILPQFQHLAIGDWVPMGGEPTPSTAYRVTRLEPGTLMLWEKPGGTWLWLLESADAGRTRLITRLRSRYAWAKPAVVTDLILMEIGDPFMMRECLLGIKQRAEHLAAEQHPQAATRPATPHSSPERPAAGIDDNHDCGNRRDGSSRLGVRAGVTGECGALLWCEHPVTDEEPQARGIPAGRSFTGDHPLGGDRVQQVFVAGRVLTGRRGLPGDLGSARAVMIVTTRPSITAPRRTSEPLISALSAIPWKCGDFLIADSCNFPACCEYRTPVQSSVLASVICAVGMRVTGRAAPRGGAGWGLPVSPA
jgi:hypothetical protein